MTQLIEVLKLTNFQVSALALTGSNGSHGPASDRECLGLFFRATIYMHCVVLLTDNELITLYTYTRGADPFSPGKKLIR